MVEPCPLIDLSGAPHERGVQHGRAAADRIRKGVAHYTAQIARCGLGERDIVGLVRDYLPIIEAFDPLYIEEMQGIARGAEVPFEHIALLNARTEILKLAERPDLRARLAENAPDGCTGVVVMPDATAEKRVIHAQNWDWKAECAETAVVLRIRREDGPDILTFTEAGGTPRTAHRNRQTAPPSHAPSSPARHAAATGRARASRDRANTACSPPRCRAA